MRPQRPGVRARDLAAGLLGAVLSALPVAAQQPGAGEVAFVEWVAEGDEVWLRETLRLRVRFGFEAEFLASGMVQPFRRTLELPAHLQLPGLEGLACAPALELPVDPVTWPEFALDERTARAAPRGEQLRDGVRFRVFEREVLLRAVCAGELVLPAPLLSFATAESFRQDVFGNRTPVERRDLVLHGAELRLRVRPLPSEGRPATFTGAVGSFSMTATVQPARMTVGESFKLELAILGSGDLAGFEPPRLGELRGLRVLGWVESLVPGRRTITYDLTARDVEPRQVPPIEFAFFDPAPPGTYRTIASEAVPIRVLPPSGETPAEPAPPAQEPAPGEPPSRWWSLLLFAPLLLLLRKRRGAPAPAGPSALVLRVRDAADRFRARPAQGDLLDHYATFLATLLDCPQPAVVGARLAARLETVGVPRELSERLAQLHDQLTGARYGGPAAPTEQQALELVEALVAALH